ARCAQPPQRIGLSATQRPLDEVARFLGGVGHPAAHKPRGRGAGVNAQRHEESTISAEIADEFATHGDAVRYRPVTIVDAGAKKPLKLAIEVPVENMARLTTLDIISDEPKPA